MTEAASHSTPGTMEYARIAKTEVIVPDPKRFMREAVVMPDGYECDWYYIDYYIDTPPSVMIVPVTSDGRVVPPG